MDTASLEKTVTYILQTGKGILAADESNGSADKRLKAAGLPTTKEERRKWRQFLLTADGIENYLSGVILYDETIRQAGDDGMLLRKTLLNKGILPGIKVDMGLKDFALHEGEQVTSGLDGLRERFAEYAAMGAKFAKWRSVYHINSDKGTPSTASLVSNAHTLAQYAALAQEAGIVPIVEPEVLLEGSHSIDECYQATVRAQAALMMALKSADVHLPGVILKASMVISGSKAKKRADVDEVSARTLTCFKEAVPINLGGIVFLSGGQEEVEATAHLNQMNQTDNLPWGLTFSYSRAIQNPVLKLYSKGKYEEALKAYTFRLQANSLAARGEWTPAFEKERPY